MDSKSFWINMWYIAHQIHQQISELRIRIINCYFLKTYFSVFVKTKEIRENAILELVVG